MANGRAARGAHLHRQGPQAVRIADDTVESTTEREVHCNRKRDVSEVSANGQGTTCLDELRHELSAGVAPFVSALARTKRGDSARKTHLWNSVRNRSLTKCGSLSLSRELIAWFLKMRSVGRRGTLRQRHSCLLTGSRIRVPSSHRRFTANVPGFVVFTPFGVWPSAAARFSSGFAVAISASRSACAEADCSRSCRSFSSARSRLIFSSSRRSSAVSSSSSSSSSSLVIQRQFRHNVQPK